MTTHDQPAERVPELDGIRGLAILAVLSYHIFKRADDLTSSNMIHAITSVVRVGWAGVDIFFVLSGFLITSILLKAKGSPNYFKNFYARRILRIFPLYYLFVPILFVLLPYLDADLSTYTRTLWPYFMLYLQNWVYAFPPEPSLFLVVTWSLAVEEQFYLLWPALVLLLDRKKLAFFCLGIVLFSFVIRIILIAFNNPAASFYATRFIYYASLTRLDSLAAGALVAIAFQSVAWKTYLSKYAGWCLGLSLVCFATLVVGRSAFPVSNNFNLSIFGYTLLALVGCSLIVLATTRAQNAWLRIFFRNRVLLFFGKYSYGMYLLHMPIVLLLWHYFADAKRQSLGVWATFITLSFLGAIVTSWLAWHLLEKHVLRLKRYF